MSVAMKLHYSPLACSLADHIALRVDGFECDLERVDLKTRRTEIGADFRRRRRGYDNGDLYHAEPGQASTAIDLAIPDPDASGRGIVEGFIRMVCSRARFTRGS